MSDSANTEKALALMADVVREYYIDESKVDKIVAALKDFTNSDAWKTYLVTKDLSRLVWCLNAAITMAANDGHFSVKINRGPQQSCEGCGGDPPSGIIRYTEHYIAISRLPYMSDSVRASYRAVLSQIREPLIIDLRGCGGGDPELAYFILCHLFADGEPLFELHTRTRAPQLFKAASTLPFYLTANTVTKYKGAISVVVNGHTASAAELIASVIKNRGRGKIYGSRTAATAHIYMSVQLDGLIVNLPVAKTVDPESKKSWEGVGVTPDYEVGSKEYIDLIYRNMSAEVFSPGRVGPTNPFKITIDVDKYR